MSKIEPKTIETILNETMDSIRSALVTEPYTSLITAYIDKALGESYFAGQMNGIRQFSARFKPLTEELEKAVGEVAP